MPSKDSAFAGSIPAIYDRYLEPLLFRPFAEDIAARAAALNPADILETAIAPSWEDIGRLGAIAAIRTFLNFFLERDLAEALQRENEKARRSPPTSDARP